MVKVLHTIAGLHPDSGGPARTATSLVERLGKCVDISAALATQKLNGDEVYFGELGEDKVDIASSSSVLSLKLGLPLYKNLTKLISKMQPAILHDHGIWLPVNHTVAKLAREKNLVRVVHTRGMLEPWAMSYRSYKKKLAWLAYQRRDLASAALLFATAESEADAIRNLGFKQPIAIVPNGVNLSEYESQNRVTKPVDRTRNVVFLSRIHPQKGLIGLIDAWAQVRPAGWKLTLAGPDEGGHLQEVMARVKKYGLDSAVEYRGAVEGKKKSELLIGADVFILPSFSESFGVVVAEALACGIPVIATLGTPWKGLVDNRCGWWVVPQVDSLAVALSQAMALSDEERRAMGRRGRQYAQHFDWGQIARETADVYRWLLGQAERPDCLRVD